MADYEYLIFGKKIHKYKSITDGGANVHLVPSDVPVETGDSVNLRLKDPYLTDPANAAFVAVVATAVHDTGEGHRIQYNRETGGESYRPNDFGAAHSKHNKACAASFDCVDMPTQNDLNDSIVQVDINGEGAVNVGVAVVHSGKTQAELEAALLVEAQKAFASAYISEGTGTGGVNTLCIPVYDGLFETSFVASILTEAV